MNCVVIDIGIVRTDTFSGSDLRSACGQTPDVVVRANSGNYEWIDLGAVSSDNMVNGLYSK